MECDPFLSILSYLDGPADDFKVGRDLMERIRGFRTFGMHFYFTCCIREANGRTLVLFKHKFAYSAMGRGIVGILNS